MSRRGMTGRLPQVCALMVFGIAVLTIIFCHERVDIYGSDEAFYVGLGESLSDHGTYEFNYKAHTKFPPGLPLIIALAHKAGLEAYNYFQVVGVLGALGILIAYFCLQPTGWLVALTCLVVIISSPQFFELATRQVMADLPYLFTSMMAIYIWMHIENDKARTSKWILKTGLLFMLVASFMIRTVGLSLLAGLTTWIFVSCIRERKAVTKRVVKYGAIVAVVAVFVICWFAWVSSMKVTDWPGDFADSYIDQLMLKNPHAPDLGRASVSDFVSRPISNVVKQTAHAVELFSHTWIAPVWYHPLVVIPIVLILIGMLVAIKKHGFSFVECYVVWYVPIVLVWPYDEGVRFVLPVIPFAMSYAFYGWIWVKSSTITNNKRFRISWLAFGCFMLLAASISILMSKGASGKQSILSTVFWFVWIVNCVVLVFMKNHGVPAISKAVNTCSKREGLGVSVYLCLLLIICTFGGVTDFRICQENFSSDATKSYFYPTTHAGLWIKENVRMDQRVMASFVMSPTLHRLSKKRIIDFPVTSDSNFILDVMSKNKVDFVIIFDTKEFPYFLPTDEQRLELLLAAKPSSFNLVYKGDGYGVFRVLL